MDGLCENLFAGARFAGEQYRGVCGRDLAGQFNGVSHRFRRADDRLERRSCFRLPSGGGFPLRFGFFHRAAQQRDDLRIVVAFGDVVERAVLDRLHAVRNVAVGGQQDHFGIGRDRLDPADQVDSVAVRQFDVAQHDLGARAFQLAESRRTVFGLNHFVSFQADDARQQAAQLPFVVDDKYLVHMPDRIYFFAKVKKGGTIFRPESVGAHLGSFVFY